MSFDQRFQLAGRIADSIGQTDHALAGRQISTGRSVTIHLLAGGHSAANEGLLADIAALPPEYHVCFVETGDHNGTPYIITDVLAGNPPLRQWMVGLKAKIAVDKVSNPHDLTRVRAWKIPAWANPGQAAPQPEATTLAPRQPEPVAPPRSAPVHPGGPDADEFSRLLAAIDTPKAAAPAEPGEFTRLLRAQPEPPAQAAPAPPAAEAGEFTRLLRAQPEPPAQAATPADIPRVLRPQSAAAAQPAVQPPAAPPASDPGEFTRLLRAQSTPPTQAAPVAAPPEPPPSEPGDFTRLLRAQSAPPTQAAPPAPQPS